MNEPKKKVIVFAWDIAHNAVGRAFLFVDVLKEKFDVTLIGPKFKQFGDTLWSPLVGKLINYRGYEGSDFPTFYSQVKKEIKDLDPDFIIACKTRIPSILPALLLKKELDIPVFLDIDDSELSFFKTDERIAFEELIANKTNAEFLKPYSKLWTQYSDTLVNEFDQIITSNKQLQKRYGGVVMGHVRDEGKFKIDNKSRKEIRTKLGYTENDKVILFAGTPRRHKGVIEIAKALKEINNPRYHLLVVGSFDDKSLKNLIEKEHYKNIQFLENSPFDQLPDFLNTADLVCVLQDPESHISKYQIPAKITDTFSSGTALITTEVPPIMELRDVGFSFSSIPSIDELPNKIDEVFLKQRIETDLEKNQNYKAYKEKLSYSSALETLEALFESHSIPNKLGEESNKFFGLLNESFGPKVRDFVFFWKQNDTDIYGRRQDMFLQSLAEREDVGKIIHIDAPIGHLDLINKGSANPQGASIFLNTRKRIQKQFDSVKIKRRTFVYRQRDLELKDKQMAILGVATLPKQGEYMSNISKWLKEEQVTERESVFWLCPIIPNVEDILAHFNPFQTITDIIDDQRVWAKNSTQLQKMNESYINSLSASDLVITNCLNTHNNITEFGFSSMIVPNGGEKIKRETLNSFITPKEIEALPNQKIGYVGNLDPTRLDLELIEKIARTFKDSSIIFIGSTHMGNEIIETVEKYDNVHLLGIKKYPKVLEYIAQFDVCLIPHLYNEMTRNMNPLKLYCYAAVGRPIVATKLDGLHINYDGLFPTNSHNDFIEKIQKVLSNPKEYKLSDKDTWVTKLDQIFDALRKIKNVKKRVEVEKVIMEKRPSGREVKWLTNVHSDNLKVRKLPTCQFVKRLYRSLSKKFL